MEPAVSTSIIGYVTAYILLRRSPDRASRAVWRSALYKFDSLVQAHWGW